MAATHLVLYDGVCGLCNGLVQFLLPRDTARLFAFASLQSETGRAFLARFGRTPDDLETFGLVTDYASDSPALLTKADAALFVLDSIGHPWRALAAARVLPRGILNRAYDTVARHRYRVFGRRDRCIVPMGEYAERFLDV